jgi:aldehyde:ferredoxin oxidoreductase
MYGWMGTILRVDLTSGKIDKEPLSDWLRLNYLGGRGINSRVLYDSVGSEIDALSPENVLIFGTGTVVGTVAPSAGRITVTAKSIRYIYGFQITMLNSSQRSTYVVRLQQRLTLRFIRN